MKFGFKLAKFRRVCEWPIAVVAFASAAVILAYRLGFIPAIAPRAVSGVAVIGIMAGVGTIGFVATDFAALWSAHADQPHIGRRAISVLRTGLKIRTVHGVCHACLGRGFTWRLSPDLAKRPSGVRELRPRQDAPPGAKVTCPSCGGSGFIDL